MLKKKCRCLPQLTYCGFGRSLSISICTAGATRYGKQLLLKQGALSVRQTPRCYNIPTLLFLSCVRFGLCVDPASVSSSLQSLRRARLPPGSTALCGVFVQTQSVHFNLPPCFSHPQDLMICFHIRSLSCSVEPALSCSAQC